MIRDTIFFDLDGTLLPLNRDLFAAQFSDLIQNQDFKTAVGRPISGLTLKRAYSYMLSPNHPERTNEQAFFDSIETQTSVEREHIEPLFNRFYAEFFDHLKSATRPEPLVKATIAVLKEKGYQLVLATNPVFPRIATLKRVAWAELNEDDFALITTYENSRFSKPHAGYYQDILDRLFLSAEQCVMVGNDIEEDLCTLSLGFEAFLLTDYLIGNIRKAPECIKGNYSDLKNWADRLPRV